MIESQNDTSIFDLVIDQEGSNYLTETAKWAKLLSILGLILSGMMVLGGIAVAFLGTTINSIAGLKGLGPFLGIIYLLLGLLYLYPSWMLLQFATTISSGLKKSDQVLVNEGLKNLKSCFRFWGILSLIIIGIYAVVIVGALIFSSFGS